MELHEILFLAAAIAAIPIFWDIQRWAVKAFDDAVFKLFDWIEEMQKKHGRF